MKPALVSLASRLLVALAASCAAFSVAIPARLVGWTLAPEGRGAWANVLSRTDRWADLLANTGEVLAVAALSCLPAATGLAAVLFRTDVPFRRLALAALVVAAASPLHVVAAGALSITGVGPALGSRVAVGLIHGIAHLPVVTLLIGVGLASASRELEEVALVEGGAFGLVFRRVTLRQAGPALGAATVLLAILVTTDYGVADALVVRTFAEEVYTWFALEGRSLEPVLVGIPPLAAFAFLLWMLRAPLVSGALAPGSSAGALRFPTGRFRIAAGALGLIVPLAILLVPVSFLAPRISGIRGLLEQAATFRPELWTSAWTGSAAAAAGTVLGLTLAWILVRLPRLRGPLFGWVAIVIACPAPVLGIGLVDLLNRPGPAGVVYDSPWILVVAYLVRFLPVATLLLVPAVRAIPPSLEAAARLEGCDSGSVLVHLVMPLCLRRMLVVFLVLMILCVAELPCSLLVTPPGSSTVASRFFGLIHYGLEEGAAALALFSALLVSLPAAAILVLLRRGRAAA